MVSISLYVSLGLSLPCPTVHMPRIFVKLNWTYVLMGTFVFLFMASPLMKEQVLSDHNNYYEITSQYRQIMALRDKALLRRLLKCILIKCCGKKTVLAKGLVVRIYWWKFHALGKIRRSRKKCSKHIFQDILLIVVLEYSDLKVLCHSYSTCTIIIVYMYFKSVFDFN